MAGQIAGPQSSCSWQLLPARKRRRAGPPAQSRWEGRSETRGGEVSVLCPRLLRSFLAGFLIDSYLRRTFPVSLCRADKKDIFAGVIFPWRKF